MSKRVKINLAGLKEIRKRVDTVVPVAQIATAEKIRDDARVNAPKDTLFLQESIHVVSFTHSDYNISKLSSEIRRQAALAVGRTPKGVKIGVNSNYSFFPEIGPDNPEEVWVVVGAMHGIANEEAVHGRTPFLGPAAYSNRGFYTAQIRKAFNGLSVRAVLTKKRSDTV